MEEKSVRVGEEGIAPSLKLTNVVNCEVACCDGQGMASNVASVKKAEVPVCTPAECLTSRELGDVLPVGDIAAINPQYTPPPAMVERIRHNFSYHSPKGLQPHRYNAIREQFRNLALLLAQQCPDSREFSVALTHLEESVMWANAAIARNEK